VTGVQTCALPIYHEKESSIFSKSLILAYLPFL
jgi:hypothetical protein